MKVVTMYRVNVKKEDKQLDQWVYAIGVGKDIYDQEVFIKEDGTTIETPIWDFKELPGNSVVWFEFPKHEYGAVNRAGPLGSIEDQIKDAGRD